MAGLKPNEFPYNSGVTDEIEIYSQTNGVNEKFTALDLKKYILNSILATPNITSVQQDLDPTVIILYGERFEHYSSVYIDGNDYTNNITGVPDANQINLNIIGLPAGSHNFIVYNFSKPSNTYTLITI